MRRRATAVDAEQAADQRAGANHADDPHVLHGRHHPWVAAMRFGHRHHGRSATRRGAPGSRAAGNAAEAHHQVADQGTEHEGQQGADEHQRPGFGHRLQYRPVDGVGHEQADATLAEAEAQARQADGRAGDAEGDGNQHRAEEARGRQTQFAERLSAEPRRENQSEPLQAGGQTAETLGWKAGHAKLPTTDDGENYR
ncbi:hypothetical protein PKB_3958 [Pseudomonas knackmussii B13]|uniref:Uncharacterized protein n=1 Tax=Pseudomonas knackmussii (strain DSM 6978 / CCUG 54928 / LMG 23759 / B13) TaxID=1301098 RepID=A0A024HL77_PSEKB|nr:hypothetical protein PKB_3958 [Pseudomonas knackmussii B13]